MALAFLHPDPEKGGRGNKGVRDGQVSHGRLSMARTVLAFSEPLARDVLAGGLSLDAARPLEIVTARIQ